MRLRFWTLYRRLFGTRSVVVFTLGEDGAAFSDEDVVRVRCRRHYLEVVCLWDYAHDPSVVVYGFPYATLRYWSQEKVT